jgi:hypothetical protein
MLISPGDGTLSLLKAKIQDCVKDERAVVVETRRPNSKMALDQLRATKAQNIEAYTIFEEQVTPRWSSVDSRVFARIRYASQEGLSNDERVTLRYESLTMDTERRLPPLPWFRDCRLMEFIGSSETPSNAICLLRGFGSFSRASPGSSRLRGRPTSTARSPRGDIPQLSRNSSNFRYGTFAASIQGWIV